MTIMTIGDVALSPQHIVSYGLEQTTVKSELIQSGVISREFDMEANATSQVVQMPFWSDLTGDSEVLPTDGSTELTVNKLTSSKDMAVINHRGYGFATQDLVKELAKTMANDPDSDPMIIVAERIGSYWARQYQGIVLAQLKGLFADSSMSGLVSDISGGSGDAAKITASTIIDAQGKMGDASDKLTALYCHSSVRDALRKQDLISVIRPSEGGKDITKYGNLDVIVDDSLTPVTGGVYTTYLFGAGAIAYGEATPDYPALETQRFAGAGVDKMYSRRKFILHPRGVAFDGSYSGVAPTNAEFQTANKWTRVFDTKNIRIVKFVHKIA